MASIAVTTTNNTALNGGTVTISVTGTATAFTATPFTVSGGVSSSIASQTVTDATHGTVVVNPGTTSATLTITDTISTQTATIFINVVTTTDPQEIGDRHSARTYSYTVHTEASATTIVPISQISNVSSVRVNYLTKGANTTTTLQGSMDNTNWYTLQAVVSGINAVLAVCEPYARLQLVNSGSAMTDVLQVSFRSHA